MKSTLLLISLFLAAVLPVTSCPFTSTTLGSEDGNVRPLRIIGHRGYVETARNVSFFTVKGVVQNNNTSNMRSINVTATFYHADMKPIRIVESRTALEIVEPQSETPFEIYMPLHSSPPPHNYSLTARGVETDESPIASLEIAKLREWVDGEGFLRIVGEVHNKGSMVAKSVRVTSAYYDLNGDLITVSSDIVYPISVIPGGKAEFELTSRPFPLTEGSFDLFIVVHHYERLASANWILFSILVATSFLFFVYMKRRGW